MCAVMSFIYSKYKSAKCMKIFVTKIVRWQLCRLQMNCIMYNHLLILPLWMVNLTQALSNSILQSTQFVTVNILKRAKLGSSLGQVCGGKAIMDPRLEARYWSKKLKKAETSMLKKIRFRFQLFIYHQIVWRKFSFGFFLLISILQFVSKLSVELRNIYLSPSISKSSSLDCLTCKKILLLTIPVWYHV